MALYPVRQRRFAGLLIGALLPSPKSRADASPVALNLGTRPRGKSRSPALRRAGPLGHFPMQLLDDGRGTRLKQSWQNGMHQRCQARTEEQQRKPQRNARVSKVVLVHRARVDNEKTLECQPHRQKLPDAFLLGSLVVPQPAPCMFRHGLARHARAWRQRLARSSSKTLSLIPRASTWVARFSKYSRFVPRIPDPVAIMCAASSAPMSANRALCLSVTKARASTQPCGVATSQKDGM